MPILVLIILFVLVLAIAYQTFKEMWPGLKEGKINEIVALIAGLVVGILIWNLLVGQAYKTQHRTFIENKGYVVEM